MDPNEEDFSPADAWLSDQLFTQIRHSDSETMESSHEEADFEDLPHDLRSISLNSFDSIYNQSVPIYSVNGELIDLAHTAIDQGSDSVMLNLAANVASPLVKAVTMSLVSEAAEEIQTSDFNATEEEMKLLEFLESQPMQGSIEPIPYAQSEDPSTACRIIKCANCSCLFDIIAFQSHICDYDEEQNLIETPQVIEAMTDMQNSKAEPEVPSEPDCIRLLRENQVRIRRFLKDELKYDVNASSNGNSNSGNSSNTSTKNKKKRGGPHECTLCERKFVHASGLLRHMEKHDLDLIPLCGTGTSGRTGTAGKTAGSSKNGNTVESGSQSEENMNGLRVVIKCTVCGRIFYDPVVAIKHMNIHYPNDIDEREADSLPDVPYESFIDDAQAFLIDEANSIINLEGDPVIDFKKYVCVPLQQETVPEAPTSQVEKASKFLKITILGCILQCEFCDLVFSEVSHLFVHSASHLPKHQFNCFSCDINLCNAKEISTHFQTECVTMREDIKVNKINIQRYFVCNVCENKFTTLEQLHEHRYAAYHFFPRYDPEVSVLQIACEYCDEILKSASHCLVHYEQKHVRKNKRDKDGAPISTKSRQYLCDICGKTYTQSSHLWQHLRFHQGVKPFACKEPGCTRKFTIRPDLNDHIRKCHTGERPYHCLVCGKRFLTGSVFYQHRLIHRGERRYECEECGKRFYRADALKNHQRIHTGEKPYGCIFCTKNFRQRGDRDKHIRARHSHLDANARLMMQMQKLQLEAAAAAAAKTTTTPTASDAAAAADATSITDASTTQAAQQQEPFIDIEDCGMLIDEEQSPDSIIAATTIIDNAECVDIPLETDDVVLIGNVRFPRSMFESIIPDIDEEAALNVIDQLP